MDTQAAYPVATDSIPTQSIASDSPGHGGRNLQGDERISYVITNYNGRDCLPRTLSALFEFGEGIDEVIVADDGSNDDTVAWLAREWPRVEVIELGENSGNICKVRNRGIARARNRYVFLMDNDITIRRGCVSTLLDELRSDPRILCATPRLIDEDHPDLIYADGNRLHFLALSCKPARGLRVDECPVRAPFEAFGGGIMLIDTRLAAGIGLFDEGYVGGWGDDGEFQLRGRLLGLRAVHVSGATCLHKPKVHGACRAYGQMHNRYRLMATVYSGRSLVALVPSLLLFELLVAVAAMFKGFARAHRAALVSLVKERHELRTTRARLQNQRRLGDGQILHGGGFELPGVVSNRALYRLLVAALTALFDLNWRLIKRWI